MAKNIHREIHKKLPGADKRRIQYTRKAFRMLPPVHRPRILDAGCGEGKPAMELAGLCDGDITALDIDRESLDILQKKAEAAGMADRIHTVQGSLNNMPFDDGSFDIIWAEATIHIIGFEKGLMLWRRFLRPGGFLVIHEVVWLQADPPQEALQHWRSQFPGIRTADQYAKLITSCGYDLVGHFNLPDSLWWDDYFCPLETRLQQLREKYASDREALKVIDDEQVEIDLYKKYGAWFGSWFFVAQRCHP